MSYFISFLLIHNMYFLVFSSQLYALLTHCPVIKTLEGEFQCDGEFLETLGLSKVSSSCEFLEKTAMSTGTVVTLSEAHIQQSCPLECMTDQGSVSSMEGSDKTSAMDAVQCNTNSLAVVQLLGQWLIKLLLQDVWLLLGMCFLSNTACQCKCISIHPFASISHSSIWQIRGNVSFIMHFQSKFCNSSQVVHCRQSLKEIGDILLAHYELLLTAATRDIQAEVAEFSVRKDVRSNLYISQIFIYYSKFL